jgi:hypothetical protein
VAVSATKIAHAPTAVKQIKDCYDTLLTMYLDRQKEVEILMDILRELGDDSWRVKYIDKGGKIHDCK